mgnify:CR=1 FL=1
MIIVIDYDAGNTANVLRALQKIGVQAELSSNRDKILAADGLILPGLVLILLPWLSYNSVAWFLLSRKQ